MNKLIEKLQNILMPIALAMNNNKYIKAMRNGFVLSLAYTMVGSILTSLFAIPALQTWFGDATITAIQNFVAPTNIMSNSIISLFVVIGVSYALAQEEGVNQLHGAMVSMVLFLIQCPYTLTLEGGSTITGINFAYLGTKAIFTAIVLAILGVRLYKWALDHKFSIKLPDSVPASIQDSFTSFLPAGVVMFAGLVLRFLFGLTPQGNMTDFVFYWVQRPLTGVALSVPSIYLYGVLVNLFWFFGLHGQTMAGSVYNPFLTQSAVENVEALAAGNPLPNLINGGYTRAFIVFGFHISVPLLIALYFYTKNHKREDWKEVMKISFAPGIFNIYEPLMFGLPLVLNPFAFIPMILTPIITHTLAYVATVAGIIPYANGVYYPITTPVGLAAALSTNSILAGILQLLAMIPLAAMWYLFLGMQDKSERANGIYTDEAQ